MCNQRLERNTVFVLLPASGLLAVAFVSFLVWWHRRSKKRARSRGIEMRTSSSNMSLELDDTFDDTTVFFDGNQYARIVGVLACALSCVEFINITSFEIGGAEFTIFLLAEL